MGRSQISVLAALLASLAHALWVSRESPCRQYCGNVLDRTTGEDMHCEERTMNSGSGLVFEQCLNCEMRSPHTSDGQTDIRWSLYNLRYAMSFCLWGVPDNPGIGNTPCVTSTACGTLKDAVEYNNLTESGGAYDYCDSWQSHAVEHCGQCLRNLANGHYLSNYVSVLDAGCRLKPDPGTAFSLDGDVFSTEHVNVSTPEPPQAAVPAPDYGTVSLGARVGIAFGAIAVLLAIAGFCVVWVGKRRRRAYLRELEQHQSSWPQASVQSGGDMFDTPVSQKPLRGWDADSPVSATHTDASTLPRYFSPHSSQFGSPVSAGESSTASGGGVNWPSLPPRQHMEHVLSGQGLAIPPAPPVPSEGSDMTIGIALGGDRIGSLQGVEYGIRDYASGEQFRG